MAGFLSLLFFGTVLGNSIYESSQADIGSKNARELARRKGEVYYCDGWHKYRATENNELVDIISDRDGAEIIIGRKTGKTYKEVKSNSDIREEKMNEAIQYCKENSIQYLPWYFPTNLFQLCPLCSGIEVETGRKYLIMNECGIDKYSMVYLEDNPHKFYYQYGSFREYDAVHNRNEDDYKKDSSLITKCRHRSPLDEKDSWYYTEKIIISKEEKEARLKVVDNYPFEPYKIFC